MCQEWKSSAQRPGPCLGPFQINSPPSWEVSGLQAVEEPIHSVATKLSWVGGSVQTSFGPCLGTEASDQCPSAAARGSHREGQGENSWFRLHFLYQFMCVIQVMVPSAVCFLPWSQIRVLVHLAETDLISFETWGLKPRTWGFASNHYFFRGKSSSREEIIPNSMQFFLQANAKIISLLHLQQPLKKLKACWDKDWPLPSPVKKGSIFLRAYWISELYIETFCTEKQPSLPLNTFVTKNKWMAAARCVAIIILEQRGWHRSPPGCLAAVEKHGHRHSMQHVVVGFTVSALLIQRLKGITNTLQVCGSIYCLFPDSFKQVFFKRVMDQLVNVCSCW